MKVAFRVDAATSIGAGHLVRCITLGRELQKKGADILFLCQDFCEKFIPLLQQNDFRFILLHCNQKEKDPAQNHVGWSEREQNYDARQSLTALATEAVDWLVVDHYGLDVRWESQMRSAVHNIFVIDDLANRKHDCDVLLDQNFSFSGNSRYAALVPAHCRIFCGPCYALLRPEYQAMQSIPRNPEAPVRNVLVSLGAIDPENVTRKVLESFTHADFSDILVHVVIGKNNPHRRELAPFSNQKNIIFHDAPEHLAQLMAMADLAIGAGGTTTWERMCVGLPALVLCLSENQLPASQALHEAGFIHSLGISTDVSIPSLQRGIRTLLNSPLKRKILSENGNRLVDGLGVNRALHIFFPTSEKRDSSSQKKIAVTSQKFSLRFVTDEDSWINAYLPQFIFECLQTGHHVAWGHEVEGLTSADFCFYLSCGRKIQLETRKMFRHNLIVHESNLPAGKGWSPLTWQVLEGKKDIPVSLLEAEEKIDSGKIYAQTQITLRGTELVEEIRAKQAAATFQLCYQFLEEYPQIVHAARAQSGQESFYPRRTPKDSELDLEKSLASQIPVLRVVDNMRYPAWFHYQGEQYILHVLKKPKE
jgi:UDP-2,4-diacetamido-2,4,6-trideoxy-beta-L-altropyranose hydrolase